MDKQSIVNDVVPRLLAQGPAATAYGSCRYRIEVDNQPRMCAVGMLIKDEFYTPSIENKLPGCGSPELTNALVKSGVPEDLFNFLRKLQECHDSAVVTEESEPLDRKVDFDGFGHRFTKNVRFLCSEEGLISPV